MNISSTERHEETFESPHFAGDQPARRPYASPGVVELGTVAQLTQGQGSFLADGGNARSGDRIGDT